jgi:hypothetical protein
MADIRIIVLLGEVPDTFVDVAEQIRGGIAASDSHTACILKMDSPDALSQSLSSDVTSQNLILYDPAEAAVARSMGQGNLPSESLKKWKQNAHALLSGCRKHRKTAVFASGPEIEISPEHFWISLGRHFKVSGIPASNIPASAPEWTSWQAVLAQQMIAMDPEAGRLNGELKARALKLADFSCDVDAAFSDIQNIHAALTENRATNKSLQEKLLEHGEQHTAEMQEKMVVTPANLKAQPSENEDGYKQQQAERNLLIQQLKNIQEELKSQFSMAFSREAALAQTKQELDTAGRTRQDLQQKIHLRDTKIHSLHSSTSQKLSTAGRTVLELQYRISALEAHVIQMHKQVHLRNTKIHRFLSSTSWKITEPLRSARQSLTGRGR